MTRISLKDAQRLGLLAPQAPVAKRKSASAPREPRPKRHRRPVQDSAEAPVVFFVPGEPVAKARARTHLPREAVVAAFEQSNGSRPSFEAIMKGVKHRTFTPPATARFERLVGQCAAAAMRSRAPLDVPLEVVIAAVFEGDPSTWPTDHSDPDVDNVEKAVMDAVKGIVWTDDRLVVRCSKVKACGPVAGVAVAVRPAKPYDPIRDREFPASPALLEPPR